MTGWQSKQKYLQLWTGLCLYLHSLSASEWRTLWVACDERFWLWKWKFVNSTQQRHLTLQKEVNPLVLTTLEWWDLDCDITLAKGIVRLFHLGVPKPCLQTQNRKRPQCNPQNPGPVYVINHWQCYSYSRLMSMCHHGPLWHLACGKFWCLLPPKTFVETCSRCSVSFTWNSICHICAFTPCSDSWLL